MSINNSTNSIWLPNTNNYSNIHQQQLYSQESLPAPNCPTSTILSHWAPNEHLFVDNVSPQPKPLVNAQSNVSTPVTSLSNELDYMSLNHQGEFQQLFGFQRQSIVDKECITDISHANPVRSSSYRQDVSQKSTATDVADIANRDLVYSRQNLPEKDYLTEAAENRLSWNNQCSEQQQYSTRTSDAMLPENPDPAPLLRSDPVATIAQDITGSQYPWLVNRWTCF